MHVPHPTTTVHQSRTCKFEVLCYRIHELRGVVRNLVLDRDQVIAVSRCTLDAELDVRLVEEQVGQSALRSSAVDVTWSAAAVPVGTPPVI